MNVKPLSMSGTDLLHYSSEPEKVIVHLMSYGNSTLIMEPGELADFAQGHKLLTNSNAEIVILQNGESAFIPLDDYAFVFIKDATVRTSSGDPNHPDYYSGIARIITKAPSYRSDNA